MASVKYSVLIRTFNSEKTLPDTLECLANQTILPHQYIFVDSGSSDSTLTYVPSGSIVHKYVGGEFNYSEALNQGLDYVTTDYVLILSSHALLIKRAAIEYGLSVLISDNEYGAAYFCNESGGGLRHVRIDKENFNGVNGLWNSCSIIRMDLLKRRKFRPEVFSAEDQEWARWLFFEEGKAIARISGAGAININPRFSYLKARNEYVSLAYFTKREWLSWSNIGRIVLSGILPVGGLHVRRRMSDLILAARLVACRYSQPKAKSRYF